MDDRDQQIREIAYFFWLEEGCPEGRADQHWAAAEAFVEAVANGQVAESVNGGEDQPGEPLAEPCRRRRSHQRGRWMKGWCAAVEPAENRLCDGGASRRALR